MTINVYSLVLTLVVMAVGVWFGYRHNPWRRL